MAGKYFAKETIIDNIKFDSKDESKFYSYLKLMLKEKKIKSFSLQPKYELLPGFTKDGKKYQKITYSPDFLVIYPDDTVELIDVKGLSTQQGELRRKMFDYRYPDLKLTWIAMNIVHGNEYGWIEYGALKKIRAANAKLRKLKEAEMIASGVIIKAKKVRRKKR